MSPLSDPTTKCCYGEMQISEQVLEAREPLGRDRKHSEKQSCHLNRKEPWKIIGRSDCMGLKFY